MPMKRFVIGACERGYSHICRGTECQDSMKKLEREDGTVILAVADGHGSRACPHSKDGSQLAVETFCGIMEQHLDAYTGELEQLRLLLHREGSLRIAQIIEQEWKQRVLAFHREQERELPVTGEGEPEFSALYKLYGSTLLGAVITDSYVFAFQIGDGDILYADRQGVAPVVQGEKLLGVESYSLCSRDAWKKAVSALWQRTWSEQLPLMFLLSTDGFANSFASDEGFYSTCQDYFSLLNEHGAQAIDANLPNWLAETSQLGCGDDTTVLIAYFTENELLAEEPQGTPAEKAGNDTVRDEETQQRPEEEYLEESI